jgi:cytochrome oxidase assembly protein ShyY1
VTGRRSLLLLSILAVVAFAILVGLGVWQLERKAWKENLISALAQRTVAPSAPLPPHREWLILGAVDEFRRVQARVAFVPGREARVYGGGSALREDIKGPGYFAFAPARLADGTTVVINRGYVDNASPDAALKPLALPDAAIDIVGALRWPESPHWFVTPYSDRQDLWFTRDHRAMAERYGWGEVAPFYIEMESPLPAGGVPRPGPLRVKLRNDHLGYAITWFGLAASLLAVFGVWVARGRSS